MADTPDNNDKIYEKASPRLLIMADVTGGLETLRQARYLTKFQGEDDEGYKARLAQVEYNNTVNETIELATGKLFRKPIQMEDVAPQFEEWAEDVTGSRTTLNEWAKNETKPAIRDGLTYAFIDMPAIDTTGMTNAQINALRAKPRLSRVKFGDIKNRVIDDQGNMIQATIEEVVTKRKGQFEEEQVTQYRVLYIQEGEVYQDLYEKGDKGETIKVGETRKITPAAGTQKVVKLPLVPYYTNKIGDHDAKPPLLEQANLTISWFNKNSQYNRALQFTGDPTLTLPNRQPDEHGVYPPIKLGSSSVVDYDAGPGGKPEFLELKGQSLPEFRSKLDILQAQMDKFKSSIQEKNNAPVTAKQISVEASDKVSQLTNWAWGCDDYLMGIMEIVSAYMGIEPQGTIQTNKDFEEYRITDQMLGRLSDMEMKAQISKQTLIELMIVGEVLPDNFDVDEELGRLNDQSPI